MNQDIQKIKDFFNKFTSKKSLYIKKVISPKSDWLKLISYTFILMIFVSLFSWYFYILISEGKIFESSQNNNTEKSLAINQDLLNKIITGLKNRIVVKDDVLKNTPPDPSR